MYSISELKRCTKTTRPGKINREEGEGETRDGRRCTSGGDVSARRTTVDCETSTIFVDRSELDGKEDLTCV